MVTMHPVFVLVRIPNGNVNDVIGLFTHREVLHPHRGGGFISYRRRANETPSTPCVSRLQSSQRLRVTHIGDIARRGTAKY